MSVLFQFSARLIRKKSLSQNLQSKLQSTGSQNKTLILLWAIYYAQGRNSLFHQISKNLWNNSLESTDIMFWFEFENSIFEEIRGNDHQVKMNYGISSDPLMIRWYSFKAISEQLQSTCLQDWFYRNFEFYRICVRNRISNFFFQHPLRFLLLYSLAGLEVSAVTNRKRKRKHKRLTI